MQTKPTILHMSSVHHLYDTRITYRECASLLDMGYKVKLVTTYELTESKNLPDNLEIISTFSNSNRLIRVFVVSWKVFFKSLNERASIYHFHDPELIPAGLLLKLLGKKVIYDVHEDYSKDVLTKYWIPKYLRKIISMGFGLFEKFSSKYFDGIVCATESIANKFSLKLNTITIHNYPSIFDLPLQNLTPYVDHPKNIVYVGNITEVRGIRQILMALDLISESTKLILGGKFSPKTLSHDLAELSVWQRVQYLGFLDRKEVVAAFSNAKVGLLIYLPVPNHLEALPNKLFEYMAAGLPIVVSDFPLWKKVIEDYDCGLVVNPYNSKNIAEAIQWLLDNPNDAHRMGENGRRAVETRYNWSSEAKKLKKLYMSLI